MNIFTPKSPRDFQRQRVYDSERPLIIKAKTHGLYGGEFEKIEHIDSFIGTVLTSRWYKSWVKKHGPNLSAIRITVGDGRRRKRPGADFMPDGTCILKFPRGTRTMFNVLHEIAHAIVTTKASHHGRRFCATYLELVRRWIGKEAHAELKKSFKEHNVKFRRRSK